MLDHVQRNVDRFLHRMSTDPLATVAKFYADCLVDNSKALEYLQRNALLGVGRDVANPLQIGFADRSLGKCIPKKIVKLGRELRSKLEQVGVYRANGREHFRGMVTLPLWSFGEGDILAVSGIYGLRIDRNSGGEREQSIGAGIVNAQAMNRFDELIVCESVREAWTFIAAGHENAICALGDVAIPPSVQARAKRVILASPEGEAGPFAACESFRLRLPPGISVNQYALKHASDSDPLGGLIRHAPWLQAAQKQPEEVVAWYNQRLWNNYLRPTTISFALRFRTCPMRGT
ncbi:MAG: hypothetical protein R3C53_03420 [Pirellulaceae bacterium]